MDAPPLLRPIVPQQIWHAQQAFSLGPLPVRIRMTVVRLDDGTLWVHSPIAPRRQLVAELAALGEVRPVVAPNKTHHLYFLPFLHAFPLARGWVAPGLGRKRSDLAPFPILDEVRAAAWAPALQPVFVEGLPILNETVWLHAASGTLILTDLLVCFGRDSPVLARFGARLLGLYRRPGMSPTVRPFVRDRAALRRSVDRILALQFRRVVLAHDQIIEEDARERLRQAFAWLQP